MKIGIYPGSFNPYHVGHHNIYLKARQLFDKVYLAKGINPEKEISEFIIPNNIPSIEYDKSLIDGIKHVLQLNSKSDVDVFIVRGFRNIKDVEYQQTQDYWLKQNYIYFKSIYIECEEQYKQVSSSAINELKRLNLSYKHLLPKNL